MKTKLYSIHELARLLKLHPKTILRFIHEGKIAARKLGRSWRVTEDDLKAFCHGELAGGQIPEPSLNYDTLKDRIRVSAVIEIVEQNLEEASRISNSIIAMRNCDRDAEGNTRYDFFYYPELESAKYVFYGSLSYIRRIMSTFEQLCYRKGDQDEETGL